VEGHSAISSSLYSFRARAECVGTVPWKRRLRLTRFRVPLAARPVRTPSLDLLCVVPQACRFQASLSIRFAVRRSSLASCSTAGPAGWSHFSRWASNAVSRLRNLSFIAPCHIGQELPPGVRRPFPRSSGSPRAGTFLRATPSRPRGRAARAAFSRSCSVIELTSVLSLSIKSAARQVHNDRSVPLALLGQTKPMPAAYPTDSQCLPSIDHTSVPIGTSSLRRPVSRIAWAS